MAAKERARNTRRQNAGSVGRSSDCAAPIDPKESANQPNSQPVARVAVLAALYDRYAPMVYTLARRIVGPMEQAEAVTEDVFVHLWHALDDFTVTGSEGTEHLSTWLLWLTHSLALTALDVAGTSRHPPSWAPHRAGSGVGEGTGEIARSGPRQGADSTKHERLASFESSESSVVLDLAFFQGLSCVEIAARTGSTPERVMSELRTALRRHATPRLPPPD